MALPTLRQLQFLTAIADHGSFSRAAEACHVTQPTLSSGIKELEAILEVQLVEREARGARLSHAGEIAAKRAQAVLVETAELKSAVRDASKPLTGDFRLGAIPTVAPFVLPRVMTRLKAAYPDLSLRLREDLTDRLLDDVKARRLDAALIALPHEMTGIETEILSEDEFLMVTPQGHRLASKNAVEPGDLADENLLLLEDGHCLRDHAAAVCGLAALKPNGTEVSATSLHTLVQMVSAGLGVSVLPRLAAGSGLTRDADLAVRAFSEPVIGRSIGVAWRAGSSRETEARLIGQVVKAALANEVFSPGK